MSVDERISLPRHPIGCVLFLSRSKERLRGVKMDIKGIIIWECLLLSSPFFFHITIAYFNASQTIKYQNRWRPPIHVRETIRERVVMRSPSSREARCDTLMCYMPYMPYNTIIAAWIVQFVWWAVSISGNSFGMYNLPAIAITHHMF